MIITNEYRAAPGGEGPHAGDWADKPHRLVYDLCNKIDLLRLEVAELVGLLRLGKELAEAAGDATFYSGIKMKRAMSDRDRILGLYDAAIAKHGGEA